MKAVSMIAACVLFLLLLANAEAESPPFDNDKFLEDLRNKYTDFNWVDLDNDLVLIGELDSIEYCKLRYADVDAGPFVPHARARIHPCRWIVGDETGDIELYYASLVYLDENNNISRYEIAGEPWLVPNTRMLLIASRSGAVFEDGNQADDVYFVKAIRYLAGDCMDDEQAVYEYRGSSFDPAKAASTTGIELARCIVVRKEETAKCLGDVITSILNNDDNGKDRK